MNAAAVAPYNCIARVELDCLIEISEGSGKIALIASRPAAVVPGSGVARAELNYATEVLYPRRALAPPIADAPTIQVGVDATRVQLDGAVVIADCPVQITIAAPSDGAVVVCDSGARIKDDGEIVIGDGAFNFALRHPCVTAFEI